MEREARVSYRPDWPFGENPWPWCIMAEQDNGYGHVIPAIPHDGHMVNEGNTWCPGVPGIIEVPDPVIVRRYNKDKMQELVDWLVSMGDVDGPGSEARRTVTLTKIIEKARSTYAEREQ